jgi:hypothetical protein
VTADCQDLLKQIDRPREGDKWGYTQSILATALILYTTHGYANDQHDGSRGTRVYNVS